MLVPTGRTEWEGMGSALRRLFPGHEFDRVPSDRERISHPDSFPCCGFTSSLLGARSEQCPPDSAVELVSRAAQAALGDRAQDAADAVVIIDDLELCNGHQPDRVVRVMRAAVQQHLDSVQGRFRDRTARALRERVSFHLAVPMIEAWFFADPGALTAAGVPQGIAPTLVRPDVEDFETGDAAYLAATEDLCPTWARRQNKKDRPKWFGEQRSHHPKGYLQWLCIDGSRRNCTTYSEAEGGAGALAGLDWAMVLGKPAAHSRYLRAFLADLADALGESPAIGPIVEDLNGPPLATRGTSRSGPPLLRNL